MNKKYRYKDFIATALCSSAITAILTTVSSWILIGKQLKAEQEYWKQRLIMEQIIETRNKQITIFDDTNTRLTELMLLAKSLKIDAASCNASFALEKATGENSNLTKKIDDYHKQTIEYQKKLYEFGAKLELICIYFNENAIGIVSNLPKALEDNYKNNLLLTQDLGIEDVNKYFDRDFETTPDLDSCRILLLKSMINDMRELSKCMFDKKVDSNNDNK